MARERQCGGSVLRVPSHIGWERTRRARVDQWLRALGAQDFFSGQELLYQVKKKKKKKCWSASPSVAPLVSRLLPRSLCW